MVYENFLKNILKCLSEPSLFNVEKFQCTWDHLSVKKYIYAVLLLTHISYFLTNSSIYISSRTTIMKPSHNLLIVSHLSEFFYCLSNFRLLRLVLVAESVNKNQIFIVWEIFRMMYYEVEM